MAGGYERLDSEILQTGRAIAKLFCRTLCPELVRDEENILLTAPWEEADFRVGIYLYDIQDYSQLVMGMSQAVMISDKERRMPPKAVELSYLVFCNDNQKFGGLQREQSHEILNEIIRAVYDNAILEREDGESVQLSFQQETVDFKIRLWGSFNRPLCPAVYVRAVPVLITSRRVETVQQVEQQNYDVKKK